MIAHRLSTIVDSDRIFVINDGNVEASGTHDELIKTCELYRKMWEAHRYAKDADVDVDMNVDVDTSALNREEDVYA